MAQIFDDRRRRDAAGPTCRGDRDGGGGGADRRRRCRGRHPQSRETPVEICDGRPLEAYGAATQQAVARVAAARAVLIGAPVYRASFPAS